jgi:hypothetical protein
LLDWDDLDREASEVLRVEFAAAEERVRAWAKRIRAHADRYPYIPDDVPGSERQLSVRWLRGEKDRDAGRGFRCRLAREIAVSRSPFDRIEEVVRHCCGRPWQEKIEDGADVLSGVGVMGHTIAFIENEDSHRLANDVTWHDRVADRIRILSRWLKDADSSIREAAVNALDDLHAFERENDAKLIVREAVRDAAAYIPVCDSPIAYTTEIVEDVMFVDYNCRGDLVGIEILPPSQA